MFSSYRGLPREAKQLSRRLPDGFWASGSAFLSIRNILYHFDNAVLVFIPKDDSLRSARAKSTERLLWLLFALYKYNRASTNKMKIHCMFLFDEPFRLNTNRNGTI